MSYKRGILFIPVLAFLITVISFSVVEAMPSTIYETSKTQIITSGVTHENIVRLTDSGWLNINVLRVDLSNPYVYVDTLINKESVNKLTNVKTLASDYGAVAAINAGFFNPLGGGSGYPDGPIVQSGKLISAWSEFNRYNDVMGSFSIDHLNNVLYDYWKTSMTLETPSGKSIAVMQYNKPSRSNYTDITIFDRRWGKNSIGVTNDYPDIVEIVVNEGIVTEIRQSQPAAEIPVNGYVIVSRQANGKLLLDNFNVGDPVIISMVSNPDWNKIRTSVAGASILLKDGNIPSKFSYDIPSISNANPRTMVGSTKDGKQLILVTVDGRQNASIGLNQRDSAELMLQLGAYNALNLDGGGSTTMITRTPGTNNLNLSNVPSDGSMRAVSTAIGVFSIAPPSELNTLIIDTKDINVFVNTSRAFTVRGIDKYFNPVEIDLSKVEWSVSGIKGYFKDNIFYPESVGDGKITAKLGNVTGSIEISSLSAPVELKLDTKQFELPLGKSRSLSLTGKNKNGYSAIIDPADAKWIVSGNIGKFDKPGVFTGTSPGFGYIDVSVGNTHAYCAVSVAEEKTTIRYDFEKNDATFFSYPSSVQGSYSVSSEQVKQGNAAGKLVYDFTNDLEVSRAAYVVFPNGGITLDAGSEKLGVWVYNSHPNSNWLRGEVIDSSGNKKIIDFSKSMDWTEWKYVEASIGSISLPAKLVRLYVVQTNPLAEAGFVYFDNLTSTTSIYPAIDMAKVPKDTVAVDEANKSVEYKKSNDSFRFAVLGQSVTATNPLQQLLLRKFTEKANNFEAAAFVGSTQHESAKNISKPVLSTVSGYKSFDIQSSRFIQLDTSKKGIRATNTAQWKWLLQQLDTFTGKNVFIFLPESPENFSDKLELDLFKKTLTQYRQQKFKNVWVFYSGSSNSSYMERGVKYISADGLSMKGLKPNEANKLKYIQVTIMGDSVTFEFKPLV